jgi:predicted nucleic acid-binding protein
MVVFADACYWIASLNERDSLHEIATLLSDNLGARRVVTTELVLIEILNFFAELGPEKRRAAVTLAQTLREDTGLDVIDLSETKFWNAVAFYNARPDQEWGLVDCASFQIMQTRGIHEALTNDHHFTQAGFTILM